MRSQVSLQLQLVRDNERMNLRVNSRSVLSHKNTLKIESPSKNRISALEIKEIQTVDQMSERADNRDMKLKK